MQKLEGVLIDSILEFAVSAEQEEYKLANAWLEEKDFQQRVRAHVDEQQFTALDRALAQGKVAVCVKLLKLEVPNKKGVSVSRGIMSNLITAILEEEKDPVAVWEKIILDSSPTAFFNRIPYFHASIKELINTKTAALSLVQKISLLVYCLFTPDLHQADFQPSVLCLMKKKFFTPEELKKELREAIAAACSLSEGRAAIQTLWQSGLKEKMALQDEKDTTALDQVLSEDKAETAVALLELGFAYDATKIKATAKMAQALLDAVLVEQKGDDLGTFVACYSSLKEVRDRSKSLYLILVFYKRELVELIQKKINQLLDDDKIKLLEFCLQGYDLFEQEVKASDSRSKSMLCELFAVPRNKKNNTPLYEEIVFDPKATKVLKDFFEQWKALQARKKKASVAEAGMWGRGSPLLATTRTPVTQEDHSRSPAPDS